MDPITDIVTLLRPHAVFSKPITGKGNWGVRYAAYKEPGFAIVLQGQCWLAVRGREPVLLERGDFVLLPASPAFALYSRPGAKCSPGDPSVAGIRHGDPDGEPEFVVSGNGLVGVAFGPGGELSVATNDTAYRFGAGRA